MLRTSASRANRDPGIPGSDHASEGPESVIPPPKEAKEFFVRDSLDEGKKTLIMGYIGGMFEIRMDTRNGIEAFERAGNAE